MKDSLRKTGRRRLYLMRHGHVDYFAPGLTDFRMVPLTEEGETQAASAGQALANVPFDAVFHSGLPRTAQTAGIVARAAAGRPEAIALTDFEEIRGGQAIAPTREALAAQLAFSFDQAGEPGATFLPGGEAFAAAMGRVRSGLRALVEDHAWTLALLVAHDGINRLLFGHVCGAGPGGAAHFEQDLAAINVLDFDVIETEKGLEIVRVLIKAVNVTTYDTVKAGLPRTSLEHLFDIDFGGARPISAPEDAA